MNITNDNLNLLKSAFWGIIFAFIFSTHINDIFVIIITMILIFFFIFFVDFIYFIFTKPTPQYIFTTPTEDFIRPPAFNPYYYEEFIDPPAYSDEEEIITLPYLFEVFN